jgi:hypothetical protein
MIPIVKLLKILIGFSLGYTICLAEDRPWAALPDPKLTPGDVVTNVPIETILAHGYTASKNVRKVSKATHEQAFIRYFGSVPSHPGDYEVDHLISLELGGSNSISNLWPQAYFIEWNARVKDRLENRLAALCREELRTNGPSNAEILLKQFQIEISTNWTNAFKKHIAEKP